MIKILKNIKQYFKKLKFVKDQKKNLSKKGTLLHVFSEKKQIFIHIPKTAGTSINAFFHPEKIFDNSVPDYDALYGWCPERKFYLQHATSKQLVETRGSGVYAHLKELRQLDYITHQNVGRLKIYTTTEKFQKYFGIQGDVEDLKSRLFSKVRKTAGRNEVKSTPQIITKTE